MKFIITQRRVEIDQATRDYAERKLEKLEKYFSNDASASLTFNVLRESKILEVTVEHNGLYFRAEQKAKDYLTAIDNIVDILERQIRKHKTKLGKRLKEEAFADIVSEDEAEYEIVRKKSFDVKSYTVDEAILQMEMLGHNFFFFHNADDGDSYSVIYARKDGGYGIILG